MECSEEDVNQEDDEEMMNTIMMREIEWAEHSMEKYKRKSSGTNSGTYPLRSSISAPHVHTNEWKQDSIKNVFSDLVGVGDHRQRSRQSRQSKDNNDDDIGDDITTNQIGNLRRSSRR